MGTDGLAMRVPNLGRLREMEIQLPWRGLEHWSFCWPGRSAKLELLKMFAHLGQPAPVPGQAWVQVLRIQSYALLLTPAIWWPSQVGKHGFPRDIPQEALG